MGLSIPFKANLLPLPLLTTVTVYVVVPDTKLEDQICTIHSYFRGEYLPLQKYEKDEHKKFCDENIAMKHWNKGSWDKHPLYAFDSHAHGKEMTYDEYWMVCNANAYYPYNKYHLKNLKEHLLACSN